jgi:hypothetical protein
LPDNAEVSVVSIGLLEAAVATGSCAMPATDPGPAGFCAAYSEQPGPIRSAAGSAFVDGAALPGGAEALIAGAFAELPLPSAAGLALEHPEKPAIARAARAAAATVLACLFIWCQFLYCRMLLRRHPPPPVVSCNQSFGVSISTDGSEVEEAAAVMARDVTKRHNGSTMGE